MKRRIISIVQVFSMVALLFSVFSLNASAAEEALPETMWIAPSALNGVPSQITLCTPYAKKLDWTELNELSTKAEEVDPDKYTPESFAQFLELKSEAALDDLVMAEIQEALDRAARKLKEAFAALVEKHCPSEKFTDAPAKDNLTHEGIDYCIKNGCMNGVSETVFSPQGNATRAQIAAILMRYLQGAYKCGE